MRGTAKAWYCGGRRRDVRRMEWMYLSEYVPAPTMTGAIETIIEARQNGSSTAIVMGPKTDIQDTRGLIEAIEKQ